MKLVIVLLSLLSLFLLAPVQGFAGDNLPTTGTTKFFDDFVSSGFPVSWIADSQGAQGNITQIGGYLVSTIQSGSMTQGVNTLGILAKAGPSPLYDGLKTGSTQFIQIVFKAQPFNATNPIAISSGSGSHLVIERLQLGFANSPSPFATGTTGAIFDLFQGNGPLNVGQNSIANLPGAKSAVILEINKPMPSATNAYFTDHIAGNNYGILYNGGNSPIDLSAQHIFTIQMQVDNSTASNSWIRWQVDNLGWMKLEQTACSCITGITGDISNLFPFIYETYTIYGAGGTFTINQSLASQIDYGFATTYVPSALPSGQLLSSNIHPPTSLPQPYNPFGSSTGSLVAFMQFYANEFAPGNIYAGGMLLTGMIVTVIAGVLGAIIWRVKRGIREMGFMWSLSSLGIVFFMFYCGIVPLWLPVIQTILSAGIVFGIVRTGSPSSGGYVPD